MIPRRELTERFSHSSGPGGQHVNTSDSRVELRWDLAHSRVLDEFRRATAMTALGDRLVDGAVAVVVQDFRSQWRNRQVARARLASLVAAALAPPGPARRPTKPSRAAVETRIRSKKRRSQLKRMRSPVDPSD